MKVYLVGGAVRDKLMGLEPKDLDYVVVGSSPKEMLSLGYKQVGSQFPVFLHPQSGDEYALARIDIKDGVGYQGFNCIFDEDVTLEEDLKRRDLTINSIAEDVETGEIIDPFGGRYSIQSGVIEQTSHHFKEDPVRVLRVARFLSTLPNLENRYWQAGQDVYASCVEVWGKEQTFVTAERVFKELNKALAGSKPWKFFELMVECFNDDTWFIEYKDGINIPQPKEHHPELFVFIHQQLCLEQGVKLGATPRQQFAILCHDFGKAPCYKENGNLHGHEKEGVFYVNQFCNRLKVPNSYRELALKVCEFHTHCHKAFEMKPNKIMKLFENLGCVKNPKILEDFVLCCEANAKGRTGFEERVYNQGDYLLECIKAVLMVDTKDISSTMIREGKSGILIGEAIRVSRINAIREVRRLWE